MADAEPWCKIFVRAGTYLESVTIDQEHVQLVGVTEDGPSVAQIVATGGSALIITAGFVEVCNLAISATNQHGIQATAVQHHIHDLAIEVHNTSGSNKNGIWLNDSDRTIVERVTIDGNYSDDVIGILIGDNTVDAEVRDCYIENCGDGVASAGCIAGVCTNNGYAIGVSEDAQRARIHNNTILGNCVGVYFYKVGGDDFKGHAVYHNNFFENCNYDVYDQYTQDNAATHTPSGIMIRENFFGYDGWYDDANRDGRADYMVSCNTNKDYMPLSSPMSWETPPVARSNKI
ncbi:MAG: right-handed parallel beta-helix repeat-containing protein [Sphaerochaeta sp.]|jgi:pectin methylesterase-like acyl-CoA thioesterase|nr:right-handed parallel beta-helix repeat-containing protein [Sphaerochaeta sp.]